MRGARRDRGFTLAEVLLASVVLMIALMVLAAMFPTSYRQVADAGKMTIAVSAGRQILEDVGALPFASVANLDGFSTASAASLPAADPELSVARRWRYMIAGDGNGFVFTSAEQAAWGTPTPFGGQATVSVTAPSATLRQVTVTVSVPGAPAVQLSTMVVALF